ncbi:MAG: hypothetical protein M5R38_03840 [Candidatus Methylomirabilis sp.]|nr:hypothetical protein [Candidatus Methylomirabilis sp.]
MTYGVERWGDLFTARQKVALLRLIKGLQAREPSVADALIALHIGKGADGNSSLSRWMAGYENPVNCFSRQAIPMVWDFCESTPESQSRGVFLSGIEDAVHVVETMRVSAPGQIQQGDATESPLPDHSAGAWFTDPPYYDAIAYAYLSDFFFRMVETLACRSWDPARS